MKPELFERLIDRLGLALDVARTSVRLRNEVPDELELRGLSRAEVELINAYLDSMPVGLHAGAVVHERKAPVPSASNNVVWIKDKASKKPMTKARSMQFK
ncbi:hypothetical protein PMM47T1_26198 [Pseudomonas sp. M47T1]|nr:hypothetical protein PMM47T1_26198 [Pseudomonas sp. M47T1]